MMEHLLIPGVQYGQKADMRPEVTPVRSDRQQCFGHGAEEHAVNQARILKRQCGSSCGNVKTTWQYGTGRSSADLASSHLSRAVDWHFGQWRFLQELYAMA